MKLLNLKTASISLTTITAVFIGGMALINHQQPNEHLNRSYRTTASTNAVLGVNTTSTTTPKQTGSTIATTNSTSPKPSQTNTSNTATSPSHISTPATPVNPSTSTNSTNNQPSTQTAPASDPAPSNNATTVTVTLPYEVSRTSDSVWIPDQSAGDGYWMAQCSVTMSDGRVITWNVGQPTKSEMGTLAPPGGASICTSPQLQ